MIKTTTALALVLAALATGAQAQEKTIKIGSLSDQSGLYADLGGPGSTLAARMAVEDSGLAAKGWKIEVIAADHQNKPDVGTNIAKQWFDVDKVDVIVDVPNSGVALAVNQVARDKNKVFLNSGAATSDLTGKACSPNTIHWTYDTYALANTTGKAVVKAGGDSWFFVTADYAFGQALERDTEAVVTANGGKVVGKVRGAPEHGGLLVLPPSSAGIQGQNHRPCQCRRRYHERDQTGGRIRHRHKRSTAGGAAAVHFGRQRARPECRAGVSSSPSPSIWDMNDQTRAFAKKFSSQMKNGAEPTMVHAGVYSSVLHYLKAADALGFGSRWRQGRRQNERAADG